MSCAIDLEGAVPLADKQWSESCYVERDKLGFYMVVSSTRQAMNLLSRYWPVSQGEAYFNALRVFGQVMIEKLPPDQAREAFLAAAREANVFVSDVPRLMNFDRI
jgi:hypothetical protein